MKRFVVLFLSILCVSLVIAGCGKTGADISIDGEYKLSQPINKFDFNKDTTLIISYALDNTYGIGVRDQRLKTGNGKNEVWGALSGTWNEENRTLVTDFGIIYFSWFEYNVVNRAPLKWFVNLEGHLGSPDSDVVITRVKY